MEKRPLVYLGLLMTTTIQDIHIIIIVSLLKGKLLSMASCPDSSRADYILYNLHFQFSKAILTSYLDGCVGSFHALKHLLPSVLKADHQWWEEQSLCLPPLSQDCRFYLLAVCLQNVFKALQKWPFGRLQR